MSELPTQAEIDEANSTHEQEVEEQEVLKLAEEFFFDHTSMFKDLIIGLSAKLRKKDAVVIETEKILRLEAERIAYEQSLEITSLNTQLAAIAQLKEENAILYAEDKRMQTYNSEIYQKTEALSLRLRLLTEQDNKLQSELSEVRAREAMLVDWVNRSEHLQYCTDSGTKPCSCGRDVLLSASSTEVAKYIAERDAKVYNLYSRNFRGL